MNRDVSFPSNSIHPREIYLQVLARISTRLSAEKGAGEKDSKRTLRRHDRRKENKPDGSVSSRGRGGGKKTTGRWKLVDRESVKGEGQHGARKIGPAKISLISLSEIAAKCNASPVDERAHRRPAPSPFLPPDRRC